MRRRLLVVSMALVSVLLVSLMVPLMTTFAADRTQDMFVDRSGDVTRFAVLAQNALEGAGFGGLETDLERYSEVYGGTVLVVNANQEVVASSGPDTSVADEPLASVVQRALAGSGSAPPPTVWPWGEEPVVIGSPVGRDAQVLGAVVLVAPTDGVQGSVAWWFLWLALAGVCTLLLTAYGVVVPFVGWILRPVGDLEVAAERLAHGDLSSRVPHQTGPPELRHLAGSFNVMADNVETSQQQQRDLVADAAHQLGNPLTALRLRVENLASAGADADQVDIALEETGRLNAIVESLLDLSQVGARQVSVGPVDVVAEARHRCTLWEPLFDNLAMEAPPEAVAVASEGLVDLVLDSFLDNAVKFAPGSAVEVSVTEVRDGVVLSVRDHGSGLDAEDVGKVGARFFRGTKHQNVAGTGLGLAIVRARVADIGGTLRVAQADGGGLLVEVRLPSVRDAARGSTAAHPGAGPAAR